MADDPQKNESDGPEETSREEVSEEREPRVQDGAGSGRADAEASRQTDSEAGDAGEQSGPEAATDDTATTRDPQDLPAEDGELSAEDLALLADAERDIVAEYREIAARAQADLKNFRTRVERDRAANRDAVIAEVIRSLLPAIDDLDRAEAHGDLAEGTPLAIVAQKLRSGFDKYGLTRVGETGERFDPNRHEALVRIPTPEAEGESVGDVIQVGYALGDRLIRAAKVAVHVPE